MCASQLSECVSHMSQGFFCFCSPTRAVPQSLAALSQTRQSNYLRRIFVDVACVLWGMANISSLCSWISMYHMFIPSVKSVYHACITKRKILCFVPVVMYFICTPPPPKKI